MKKLIYLIVLSLMLILLPVAVSAYTADEPFKTDLLAGQHTVVGELLVWNDGDSLYIKYAATEPGWYLTETHLHVATSLDDIPQRKGNPVPGQFDYKAKHDSGVTGYIYVIELNDWGSGTELFIATQAVVCQKGGRKGKSMFLTTIPIELVSSKSACETAWGDGDDFPGKNWATYFTYRVQPFKGWNLPDTATVQYVFSGGDSYFDGILSNVPAGYDITNQTYEAWCADSQVFIDGKENEAQLYSSLDSELEIHCPADCVDDEQWDKINYILNQDYSSQGATWKEIQNAIWYFADDTPDYGAGGTDGFDATIRDAIIADAEANGEGFHPGPGEWGAVITYIQGKQLTFIVVDP
jgi:hypothetical protein